MIRPALIFLSLVLGLVFLVLPTTEPKDFFLFSEMKLTFQTHVYFICEKLVLVILAYVISLMETKYPYSIRIFFWLTVADLTDYLLSYNSIWFTAGIPISMNVLKCLIFGLTLFHEWTKTYRNSYR